MKKFVYDDFNNQYPSAKEEYRYNQQSKVFDKLRLGNPDDYCLFYYDTFLINPEEICLNAVSLFSYICNKYIDENRL
jgi:hypothetical protein